MKVAVFCGVRVGKYFVRWYIIILWSGVRIPPLLPKIQPRFIRGLIFGIVVADEDPRVRGVSW